MDRWHKRLARVVTQLRGLTLSQRLALLLGGALVAISVFWIVHWAATPEMVPLLPQDFAPEELVRVQSGLELMNEPYKLSGRKLLVRADASKPVILARLTQQDKLPADTSAGFNALVKEANPWISQAEHERRWAVALKHELEQVLQQFSGVRSASVFLPLTPEHRGLRNEPAASASVTLIMEGGLPVSRQLALAAARLITGAVRGLPLKNVEVLDGNGLSALDWESESAGITGLERQRSKHEQDVRAKIISQLPDPKVRVGVQVEVELKNQSVESETPARGVESSSETTNEETTRVRDGSQPGVEPNVAVRAGGRAADERTTKAQEKTEFKVGLTRKSEATPPGGIKEIWAAVNVSHSYLAGIFRRATPDAGPPSEKQIQEVFEREKPRIVSQLTKLVKPQDEKHVAVDWYYDAATEVAPPTRASSVDDTFNLVWRYGPQSGLALLAVLALGLMWRMARRSDASEAFGLELGLPKEAIEAAQQAAKDATEVALRRSAATRVASAAAKVQHEDVLEVAPVSVGQAALTEGVLVAQEVDEKTVQTQKMLDQVAQIVTSDPQSTSALLEQWVQKSDSYPG
jgi:flagellar biosynthesis/type III secretory pathway M-ring protein FliF/YscJ